MQRMVPLLIYQISTLPLQMSKLEKHKFGMHAVNPGTASSLNTASGRTVPYSRTSLEPQSSAKTSQSCYSASSSTSTFPGL